jgi:hypothetical protein
MLGGGPRKKITQVIVDSLKKPSFVQGIGEPSKDKPIDMSKPETDNSVALEASAEKIMSAFEQKSAKSLVSALKDFYAILEMDEEPEAEEEV